MTESVDRAVEVVYTEDVSGEFGTFAFTLPNADVRVRLDTTQAGIDDAGTLAQNLPNLLVEAVRRLSED